MSHAEHQAHQPGHQHGYAHHKDDHLRRLKRIEGQARGLQLYRNFVQLAAGA